MKQQLNEIKRMQQLAGLDEAKIEIGDDGYGGKNITVKKDKKGVLITQTDPNDWGRISGRIYIPLADIPVLINFLKQ